MRGSMSDEHECESEPEHEHEYKREQKHERLNSRSAPHVHRAGAQTPMTPAEDAAVLRNTQGIFSRSTPTMPPRSLFPITIHIFTKWASKTWPTLS